MIVNGEGNLGLDSRKGRRVIGSGLRNVRERVAGALHALDVFLLEQVVDRLAHEATSVRSAQSGGTKGSRRDANAPS